MREIVISPTGKKKLEGIFSYLENEFSEKTKQEFISLIEKIVERIIKYPESYPKSIKMKSVRRCLINKHTVMFYRIHKTNIEILTFFDNRQSPDSSPY